MNGSPGDKRRAPSEREAKAMKEQLIINAICLAIASGSLVVAVWTVAAGSVERLGIDGLFAVLVCLLLAAAFSLPPVLAYRRGLWREWRNVRRTAVAGREAQPAPAARAPIAVEDEVAEKTSESK
jgi:hypothetical protein